MTPIEVPRGHVGELNLRRLRAGDWNGAEAARATAHLASCRECAARLALLDQEQAAFEDAVSFERFSAGVERATRVPRPAQRAAAGRSFKAVFSVAAAAAALALVVGGKTLFQASRQTGQGEALPATGVNRTKGAPAGRRVEVRIAPPPPREGPQRLAAAEGVERLAPGERLRVGLDPAGRRFCLVVSIDDSGQLTALFSEDGVSSPLPAPAGWQYLPGAFELTGTGRERLVVILTDAPVQVSTLAGPVAAALASAAGDLTRLADLSLDGDQFHRTFLKP